MGVRVDGADEHGKGREPIGEGSGVAVDGIEIGVAIEHSHGRNGSGCRGAPHRFDRWGRTGRLGVVHPIERLRYVARAGSAPDRVLVAEAVPALAAFAGDPGRLLVALRQLIGRQPESPGLVVLGARMLTALDPIEAAWHFVDELGADASGDRADELIEERGRQVELVDTLASGPTELLVPPGTTRWIGEARTAGSTIVALTPRGSRLPRLLWSAHLERSLAGSRSLPPNEVIGADLVDQFLGPDQAGVGWSSDCSDVAELASF